MDDIITRKLLDVAKDLVGPLHGWSLDLRSPGSLWVSGIGLQIISKAPSSLENDNWEDVFKQTVFKINDQWLADMSRRAEIESQSEQTELVLPHWNPAQITWTVWKDLVDNRLYKYHKDRLELHRQIGLQPPLDKHAFEKHMAWLRLKLFEGLSYRKIAMLSAERGYGDEGHTAVSDGVHKLATYLGVQLTPSP